MMQRGWNTAQQGMQQQSMNQMACSTMDEFDHAMQMWNQVLQGAQGCPDVEAEARAQLGALDTWKNALHQTMSRAQSASPDMQQTAQNDLLHTCSKAHTAVMRAEQTFQQEYGQAGEQMLSDIGMSALMGGMSQQSREQQPWQTAAGSQFTQQPWQQQQNQPSYQSMGSQSWQARPEQFSQRGMESQYGQEMSQYGARTSPATGMGSQMSMQSQPYQTTMGSQYTQQPWQQPQNQPSFQRGMESQQYQPSYQTTRGGQYAQQPSQQQTRGPYSQAVSQIPYSQPGMSSSGETFGPAGFSRGSYYGTMGLQQYGEPVQHERIPEASSQWRTGSQMGTQSRYVRSSQFSQRNW